MNDQYQKLMVNGQPHPLKHVRQPVLDAAREVLDQAVIWKDVDPDMAHPIADAVVQALLPWLESSIYLEDG